ncbi:prolipoprotein diacylglyceryl transferase [Thermodesulfatator atlanticus]|uniref:prolipoprotein diacylglyceryl transferase n=1 Tax=Thermodesulfatator atlanticus TaxID=501497 RepID=UPI0003B3DA5A|nr:prolipoprotein diacylglyceryl transferase [Thermodesulfatator atlanticus]
MISYPHIDPVIVHIGPLAIRWYGLMYLLGFLAAYFLTKYQLRERGLRELETHLDNIIFWGALGLIIGARLGHVFFYFPGYYLKHPLEIFALWHGGMSFHGGLLGVLITGYIYAKKHGLNFWFWADLFVVPAPIGLGLGRLGNFINGELYGRPTDVPWAMVFPKGGPIPRHPSQLYEAFGEGLVLFLLMWFLRKKNWPCGYKFATFLVAYGVIRFFIEFFREPDAGVPLLFGWMTRGQQFCFAMVVVGIALFLIKKRKAPCQPYRYR